MDFRKVATHCIAPISGSVKDLELHLDVLQLLFSDIEPVDKGVFDLTDSLARLFAEHCEVSHSLLVFLLDFENSGLLELGDTVLNL